MSPSRENREQRDLFESRLAHELLDNEWVAPPDLEEAVNQQVSLGGHLATNLWELGLVDGGKLSRLSARLLGVPEAEPRFLLAGGARDVLPRLPVEFVEHRRILPLEVVGSRLRVATCEPWDHLALGEAAFLAGYPVEPYFVAEVPLECLLAKLYGLPLGARFRLQHSRARKQATAARVATDVAWDDLPELPADIATVISVGKVPETPRVIHAPPEPALVAEDDNQLEPITSFADASQALADAPDRDAVGEILARFALSRGRRVVLFSHRGGHWSGWLGAGDGVDARRLERLILAAEDGTIFGLVSKTGAHYVGPIAEHDIHRGFLNTLGSAVPTSVALFPVHFRGKLVMGIYLDAGHGANVPTDVAEILLLAQRAPSVLSRLVRARLEQGKGDA